jgi:hypothetical protein
VFPLRGRLLLRIAAHHGMVIFCILNKKVKATGWVPRSLFGWMRAADYCTVTVTFNG